MVCSFIFDVDSLSDHLVHSNLDVNGCPARCERFAGQAHFLLKNKIRMTAKSEIGVAQGPEIVYNNGVAAGSHSEKRPR